MADYTSKTHNIYATTSFMATPKLLFSGTIAYNKSQGELEQVRMPAVSEEVSTLLPHHNLDFSEVNEYSHLDYGYLQLDLGVEFQAAPRVTLTADGEYADLSDKTGYVYGDESGSYFMVRTGVQFDF